MGVQSPSTLATLGFKPGFEFITGFFMDAHRVLGSSVGTGKTIRYMQI